MSKWLALLFASAALWAADCTRTSVGINALTDPYEAGLYLRGSTATPEHTAEGLSLASQVQPIGGKIVFLSIGMSVTSQEFSTFKQIAEADPEKNPDLVIVDGAQPDWSADRIAADSTGAYWAEIDRRLQQAGVTGQQVQAAWMKQADANPSKRYPEDVRQLQEELEQIARTLRTRYPNLRILYLSSRSYAGYATTSYSPEPYAYQSAYAVQKVIDDQILGTAGLSYAAGQAPWMTWGPYLWADGTRGRFDGLAWACADFEDDGMHLAESGRRKVAAMLLDFLKSEPTARPWFVRQPAQAPPKPVIHGVTNAASFAETIAPGAIMSIFGDNLAPVAAGTGGLPLPTGLAGVRVEAGGAPALLYYVSPGQINCVLPVGVAQANRIVVIREGVRSDVFRTEVSLDRPGLISMDGSGSGPAAAQHADYTTITADAPAEPGETILMYGTGWGVHNPANTTLELPKVWFGSQEAAKVWYYGPAPGFPGLEQINVTLPDVIRDPTVPVVVTTGDFTSNTVSIAVKPSAP